MAQPKSRPGPRTSGLDKFVAGVEVADRVKARRVEKNAPRMMMTAEKLNANGKKQSKPRNRSEAARRAAITRKAKGG